MQDVWIYIILGVPLAAIIVLLVLRAERRRREAMKQAAQMLGFDYAEKAEMDVLGDGAALPLFHRGRSPKLHNVMQRQGMETSEIVLDFQYTTGGGQSQQTHQQTVFLYQSRGLALPAFELRPEHVFHKIGQRMGFQDIDPPECPEFSERFLLRGKDEAMILKTFSMPLCQALVAHPKICAEGLDRHLILFQHNKRIKPEALSAWLETHRVMAREFEK